MVSLQQQVSKVMREDMETLFRTARHIPADRRDWSPMGDARSVQSQLTECALTPLLFITLLQGLPLPSREETAQRRSELAARITTLETAESVARENYAQLCALIEATPDENLGEMHTLPFRGGMTVTTADMLFFPLKNLNYHIGQINYLQMMLGDTEMH